MKVVAAHTDDENYKVNFIKSPQEVDLYASSWPLYERALQNISEISSVESLYWSTKKTWARTIGAITVIAFLTGNGEQWKLALKYKGKRITINNSYAFPSDFAFSRGYYSGEEGTQEENYGYIPITFSISTSLPNYIFIYGGGIVEGTNYLFVISFSISSTNAFGSFSSVDLPGFFPVGMYFNSTLFGKRGISYVYRAGLSYGDVLRKLEILGDIPVKTIDDFLYCPRSNTTYFCVTREDSKLSDPQEASYVLLLGSSKWVVGIWYACTYFDCVPISCECWVCDGWESTYVCGTGCASKYFTFRYPLSNPPISFEAVLYAVTPYRHYGTSIDIFCDTYHEVFVGVKTPMKRGNFEIVNVDGEVLYSQPRGTFDLFEGRVYQIGNLDISSFEDIFEERNLQNFKDFCLYKALATTPLQYNIKQTTYIIENDEVTGETTEILAIATSSHPWAMSYYPYDHHDRAFCKGMLDENSDPINDLNIYTDYNSVNKVGQYIDVLLPEDSFLGFFIEIDKSKIPSALDFLTLRLRINSSSGYESFDTTKFFTFLSGGERLRNFIIYKEGESLYIVIAYVDFVNEDMLLLVGVPNPACTTDPASTILSILPYSGTNPRVLLPGETGTANVLANSCIQYISGGLNNIADPINPLLNINSVQEEYLTSIGRVFSFNGTNYLRSQNA